MSIFYFNHFLTLQKEFLHLYSCSAQLCFINLLFKNYGVVFFFLVFFGPFVIFLKSVLKGFCSSVNTEVIYQSASFFSYLKAK